jgi:uncharacterized membrane protein
MAPQHNGSDAVDFHALESKVSFMSTKIVVIILSDDLWNKNRCHVIKHVMHRLPMKVMT